MVMERVGRKSSCLLTDQAKAWKFLTSIRLSSVHPNVMTEEFYEAPEAPRTQEREDPEVYTVSDAMTCSLCDAKFETRHQQKTHFRHDWHRFNLKRRMLGLKFVTEEKFAELADDVSSISGSGDSSTSSDDDTDLSPNSQLHGNHSQVHSLPGRRKKTLSVHKYESEDDSDDDVQGKTEGNGRRHPRLFFENDEGNVVSVYRCIVHGKREAPTSHSELISRTLKLLMNQKWAIMMTGGGHFAAAVFDGPEVVVHKTFHRYTVRAKRGTAQSVRDSQGNAPKSAGASIRRHNEAALNQEVQDLLAGWKPHLDACTRIFLRVPAYTRAMFYGGKSPALGKADPRVVTVPFATRRATFKELKRVWEILATVECHGSVADVEAAISSPTRKPEWKKGRKPPKEQAVLDIQGRESLVESISDRLDKQSLTNEAPAKKHGPAIDDVPPEKQDGLKTENKGDEEENEVEDEVVLMREEEVVISTSTLKEYEVIGKKRAKKKKPIAHGPKTDEETLTNVLYTICRTGDLDQLKCVLQQIQQKFCKLPQVPVSPEGDPLHSNTRATKDDSLIQLHIESTALCIVDTESKHAIENGVCSDDSCAGQSQEPCGGTIPADRDENVPSAEDRSSDEAVRDSGGGPHRAADPTAESVGLLSGSSASREDARPGKGFFKFLNKSLDDMGYTFLHVAAEDGQRAVLYHLMEAGADPGVKNKKGKPPYGCSLDKKTRDEFKRFRATYPDRFDYERAQIPAPLTSEQEKEKAAKQSERKRNARRAKRAREKKQKEADEEQRKLDEEKKKEEEKKMWFASLSDREKRALAAEKRFAQQTASTSELQRCWCCGQSLGSKVPFSYMDFKFCSMPCLKQHKQMQKH